MLLVACFAWGEVLYGCAMQCLLRKCTLQKNSAFTCSCSVRHTGASHQALIMCTGAQGELIGVMISTSDPSPNLPHICSSRKGTVDTAAVLVKEAEANSRSSNSSSFSAATGSMFVNSQAQLQRLQAAASRAQAKALGAALTAGVGFHNAAMEPADRELVEGLFKANDLAVSCGRSCLHCQRAVGVRERELHANGPQTANRVAVLIAAGALHHIHTGHGRQSACTLGGDQGHHALCR